MHALGRLQRDDDRSRRLRLLVHDGVLLGHGHELADADRLVPPEPELHADGGGGGSRARRSRSIRSPNKTYGDADFTVSATASSGLPVSFAAAGNCTVSGNTVHLTGAGSCTITASQSGDATYAPAPDVSQTFTIAQGEPDDLVRRRSPNKTFGDPDFTVSATASSGLAVSFAAAGNCTVSGNTVHLTSAGSCTITASQGGNANYNAAARRPADVHDQLGQSARHAADASRARWRVDLDFSARRVGERRLRT